VIRPKVTFTLTVALALTSAFFFAPQKAHAVASVQGMNPEVQASVWQEGEEEVGSVSINGREVIAYHSKDAGVASQKAEDLAAKLQELIDDKKVDVNDLLPGRAGDLAAIRVQGTNVLSFEASSATEEAAQPLELSWKMVNEIRSAFGAPTLPSEFLKISQQFGQAAAADYQKAISCFSGTASWYGPHFHGKLTSDGHRFDQEKMTAAHRSLPFGTKLLVMNKKTGASCVVEVNDRGPFVGNRVIDLSRGAARQLDMLSDGVASVACLVLGTN
jgi:rare lipoprotein A